MKGWREAADAGRWADVDWYHQPEEDWPELLERIRRAVPMTKDTNGLEIVERHIRDSETSNQDMKAAALVLQLGELEAAVEGDPLKASQRWAVMQDEVRGLLQKALSRGEVTEGSGALSRASHVRDALRNLEQVAFTTKVLAVECDGEDEAEWFREGAAEIALIAFAAGVEAQRALDKDIEVHGVRGQITLRSSSQGGNALAAIHAPKTAQIVNEMAKLKASHPGWSDLKLGTKAKTNGFGTSPDANRKLWKSHKPEESGQA